MVASSLLLIMVASSFISFISISISISISLYYNNN